MSVEIQVCDDPGQVCAEALCTAVASGGHVALTGGSTPRRAYELAAAQNPAAFTGAKLWFGDERCVEPDSELSNHLMVKQALLGPLEQARVAIAFCRRIAGERGPQQAAAAYERELLQAGAGSDAVEFELVLIGVGPDGHICSMFPGQVSLTEREHLVVGVPEAGHEPFVPRVTLTFPALHRAKRAIVLAVGAGKADAVAGAFADDAPRTPELPASLLADHIEDLLVLLDEDAAARL